MYSVEYLDKSNIYNCWNQHTMTRYKIMAYVQRFEAKRIHGKSNNYRIRQL